MVLNILMYLLIIIGALVVIAVIIGLCVFLYYRKFIKMILAGETPTPARIHLLKSEILDWEDKKNVKHFDSSLKSLGFRSIGKYIIEEMPGYRLKAYRHPREKFTAVLTEAPAMEAIVDLDASFPDGTSLCVTLNYPEEFRLESPDFTEKHYVNGKDVASGVALMKELLAKQTKTPETHEDFVSGFERDYAREVDWRAARGGPSIEEVRRIAEKSVGSKATNQVVADTFMEQAEQNQILLWDCLTARLKELGLDRDKGNWDPDQSENLIIHEKVTEYFLDGVAVEFFNISGLENVNTWNELLKREGIGENLTIREQFRIVAEKYAKEAKLTYMVTVPEPVEADFWCFANLDEDY